MDSPTGNPFKRFFTSSKSLLVLAITLACFASHFLGKATFLEIANFLQYVIGPYLGATALEDAAKHLAAAKRAPVQVEAKVAAKVAEVPVTESAASEEKTSV